MLLVRLCISPHFLPLPFYLPFFLSSLPSLLSVQIIWSSPVMSKDNQASDQILFLSVLCFWQYAFISLLIDKADKTKLPGSGWSKWVRALVHKAGGLELVVSLSEGQGNMIDRPGRDQGGLETAHPGHVLGRAPPGVLTPHIKTYVQLLGPAEKLLCPQRPLLLSIALTAQERHLRQFHLQSTY